MKKLGLFAAILSLTFLAACGSGGGPANPGTGPSGFTNASFSGNYVFNLKGQCSSCSSGTPLVAAAGVVTADGKGNISAGSADVNFGGGDQSGSGLTGTYTVNTDGTVNISLTISGTTFAFAATLTGPEGGYITSSGTAWAVSGNLQLQAASPAQAAGKWLFRASGADSGLNAEGMVGVFDLTGNTMTADFNGAGPVTLGTASLSQTFDTTTGRGVITISPTSGFTSNLQFVYYIVDANTMEFVSSDAIHGMQGHAESGPAAVGSPLTGSFAFMGGGYPLTGNIQVTDGGVFTGDGAGNITSGTIDSVFDAQAGETGAALTGTGVVSTSAGVTRDTLTLTATNAGSGVPMTSPVVWFLNGTRGFYLTMDVDRAEVGTINAISGSPFTDNGTFAFGQTGWAFPTGNGSQVGFTSTTLFKNNSGTITGYSQTIDVVGQGGAAATGTGTLSFDSTGTIGSLTLNNTAAGTANYRIYQYSASKAFIMEVDQNTVSYGEMTVQTAQQ